MQQASNHDNGGTTVVLNADMAEMFRAALLADVQGRARNIDAVISTALGTGPVGELAEPDVKATLELIAESVQMLNALGWKN